MNQNNAFCQKCGNIVDLNSNYCSNCGALNVLKNNNSNFSYDLLNYREKRDFNIFTMICALIGLACGITAIFVYWWIAIIGFCIEIVTLIIMKKKNHMGKIIAYTGISLCLGSIIWVLLLKILLNYSPNNTNKASDILLLLISILPVILIGTYIYVKDKNKEPFGIIVKLFFGGILSVLIVFVITLILYELFPSFTTEGIMASSLVGKFFKILFGIAIVEEGSKWLMTYLFSYHSKHFDEFYDIVLYSVFTALGFACFENILYVFQNGLTTGIFRLFTAVPAHCFFGIVMGEYLGVAKIGDVNSDGKIKAKGLTLSILLPTLFHCIYDFLAFIGTPLAMILLFATVIFGYLISIDKVKRITRLSAKKTINHYCTNCGNLVDGNFCSSCGKKC